MRKRIFLAIMAVLLMSGCTPVKEEIQQEIYYIEPAERFYITEETTVAEEETVTETTETTTVTEEETTTETPETTTVTEEETTTETTETTTVTEEETTTETTETTTVTEVETTAETTVTTTAAETETTVETTEPVTVIETETVTETADSEPDEGDAELFRKTFRASTKNVKTIGRSYYTDGVRMLTHSCSGVEFAFRGTSAEITLTSNCRSSKARVGVYLNGERVVDTMLTDEETTISVVNCEKAKNCIVSVRKLSESSYSNIGVKGITVTSEYGIIPTPERERKIEFIGDSITCGYGVDAESRYDDFSTTTEDGMKTYAALISEHFKADMSVVAWSGVGVYSSYTESSNPNQKTLMPAIYGTTDYSYNRDEWDFSKWQPDLVVINLGTNDNTWTKGIEERVDSFGGAYYDFIVQVRKANPDAYIICSLGVMGKKLMPEIQEQVERYSANTGDYRITTFEFDYHDGNKDGFGADYHPSAQTHRNMAEKMIPFISETMGWY